MKKLISAAISGAAALFLMSQTALAQTEEGFQAWVTGFRPDALAAGVSAETFDAAFDGVTLNETVLQRDAFQPEFSQPIWVYLDSAASAERIASGQTALAENAEELAAIEEQYGVDRYIVVAIWGLESAYGAIRGTTDIIEALATLAYEGRRAAWAREQLIAALQILDEGAMEPRSMQGSWAGAMGHTQFIPTSYLQYAVDYDGDGRRDIVHTHVDALASTANYLSRHGWDRGERWGSEVILPEDFPWELTGPTNQQTMSQWRSLGVMYADGSALPNTDDLKTIIIPAGARGPAFLLNDNFRTIMRYNNSTAYALGVAHLSDRIRGGEAFVGTWPRDERSLNRDERTELQTLLTAAGYDPGVADGIIGARTNAAVRAYQRDQGLPADGFASSSILDRLRGN